MADNCETEEVKAEMMEPGKNIRPIMMKEQAVELVDRLYGLKVTEIKEMVSYDDKNYRVKVSGEYNNPHIPELWPAGYTLKVLNSMDSKKKHVDAEHEAQAILLKAGIACPQPAKNLQGHLTSLEKIVYKTDDKSWLENNDTKSEEPPHGYHLVRLLTFLPGEIFVTVPYTPSLLFQAGQHIGKIEKALLGWEHQAVASFRSMWALSSVPKLKEFLYAVTDEHKAALAAAVIDGFEKEIKTNELKFRKGVIHGDYNEQNILVKTNNEKSEETSNKEYDIVGVIDFGDMAETCYVYEVGITIMYMMVESKIVDPLEVGGHVLAGYLTNMDLTDVEFDALKMCVAGRFAQSLVMGAYSYSQDPTNDYVIVTAARGWGILENLWNTPKEELYAKWRKVMDSYKS